MEINFECKKCGGIFDCDVGAVSIDENSYRPQFEKGIFCPKCGQRSIDDVLLTELGQSQLTEATLDFDPIDISDIEDDELIGLSDNRGECQGCNKIQPLDDLRLCNECAGKLDRDLIRERNWDYSVSAFGVPSSKREELRQHVISRYGEKLELIAPSKSMPSKGNKEKKRRRVKGMAKR